MSSDDIQYPSGFGLKDVVAWGTTGLVVLDEPSKTIIRTPLDSLDQERIAEAINFIHGAGVIHGDLTRENIFLDENLNAKLADFAGSSIDGSPLPIAVTASHEYPGSLVFVQGDLFAFGSSLYEIMTGHAPYNGLTDKEIHTLYSKGEFPNTEFLQAIGSTIRKCWHGQYCASDSATKDIRGIFPPMPSFQFQVQGDESSTQSSTTR
ncbi:uncharacterized protein BP5553_04560 [Venustampulla echinocandica]|uniref:EKC/KEOPS complex subunit BUD32 n=1 Tax=Venustampulla echinocandica TaxID=2656787 RepID=A0A370TNN1_9HELO|nr:uncharacterized protein BP5553_04560 [Venustampulla echinocandica]RDL37127.1 hypothetical protein BP5553_04560 [Venustampulla echinocandica]